MTSKNRVIRSAATAVTAFALIGGLAACGGNDSKADGSSAAGTSSPSSVAATATATAADKAFVRQMVPHHQSAVEMARMAEKRGEHDEIKTQLSPAIVKAQNKEIAAMQRIAEELGVTPDMMSMDGSSSMSSSMEADAKALGMSMDDMGMDMAMSKLKSAKPFDKAFIDAMVRHHRAAIRMARAELARGKNPELRAIAEDIVAAQKREIREMNTWREDWYGSPSPAGGVPS